VRRRNAKCYKCCGNTQPGCGILQLCPRTAKQSRCGHHGQQHQGIDSDLARAIQQGRACVGIILPQQIQLNHIGQHRCAAGHGKEKEMIDATLLAIEAELHQIQRDLAAGHISASEAEELLRDIDVSKFVVTTAEGLQRKAEVQALLDATITLVGTVA